MEDFLIYIGKASVAAGAFYLAYLLLFQNQKRFGFNRIYLPVSLMLSFVIPIITFTTVNYVELTNYHNSATTFNFAPATSVEYVVPAFEYQWYHYLFGMYLLGVAGFLLHLFIGHLKAIHIIRNSYIQRLFDQLINITKKDVHPFSFFNKIVLSEKTLSSPDLEMIVSHEKIHVHEKHTFDILFAELLFLFQWFNPFAWLIKGAIRDNLEYKTDDEIAKKYNPQKYQLAMVALADKKEVAPFLTALNGSQLKNRIIMMKKKTENKFTVLKQLIALPLLAVLVMGLSNKEVKTEIIQSKSKVEVVVDGKIIPSDNKNLSKVDFTKRIDSQEVIDALNIKSVVANALYMDREVPTLYIRTSDYVPGSNLEFEKFTTQNIVLDKNKLTDEYYYAIDNKIVSKAKFEKQGRNGFENVVFLTGKDATDKYGAKYTLVADATSGVPNFVIKDGKEDWPGENTNLEFYKEETPDPEKDKFYNYVKSIMKDDGIVTLDPSQKDFPYVIIDNQVITKKVVYNSMDLKFGEIIPPKEAVKEFGEKGKNGALVYSTKANSIEDFSSNYGSKRGQTITGKIIDENGDPVDGVSVLIKGMTVGTISDHSGNFKINIGNDDATLIFFKHGYNNQEIEVNNKTQIEVELKYDKVREVLYGDQKNISEKKFKYVVKGKVTDNKGKPLSGAAVLIKGKTIGVITDTKGFYSIEITEKKETLSIYMPGYQKKEIETEGEKKINVELVADPNYKADRTKIRMNTNGQQSAGQDKNFEIRSSNNTSDPLILADGKIVTDINAISTSDISSITILKDETAIKTYGDLGKNGVILITTKNANQEEINRNITSRPFTDRKITIGQADDKITQPLVIVDGIPIKRNNYLGLNLNTASKEEISSYINIEPEDIMSVKVLKDVTSMALYGEQGQNGVLMVTTKNPLRRSLNETSGDPVIIVDGQLYDSAEDADIEAEDIASMTVLKNETAKLLYGDQAKNGAIIVNTRTKYNSDKSDRQITPNNVLATSESNLVNDIKVPQGFSPNGDGVHDVFEIRGLEKQYPNFRMKIFNDEGDLVWEYKHNGDPDFTPEWWNGKNNKGKNVKRGTYSYVIELNDGSNEKKSGNIILSR